VLGVLIRGGGGSWGKSRGLEKDAFFEISPLIRSFVYLHCLYFCSVRDAFTDALGHWRATMRLGRGPNGVSLTRANAVAVDQLVWIHFDTGTPAWTGCGEHGVPRQAVWLPRRGDAARYKTLRFFENSFSFPMPSLFLGIQPMLLTFTQPTPISCETFRS
jgi:hypothetical protein